MRAALAFALLAVLAPRAGGYDWYAGDGSDGVLDLSGTASRVEDSVKTAINGGAPAGDTQLDVASSNGFSSGDLVLIIQMWGSGAGTYEFARLSAAAAGKLDLKRGTRFSYSASGAQVIRVNEYASVKLGGSPTWSASSFNNTTGGVFVAVVR